MQIARAVEHAHSRGIVHRDIKPHNVMVLKNGSVKVTDFGIARMMSKGNTLTKEALGSVHYISPEQAKGGRVDNRSDIYSLGVVMYEMMAGRPPYDGESPVAVAIQHINGGAAMPSTLNPNIPGGLEQIIMKAMALNVESRYVSAAEMLEAMDAFRKDPAMLFDYNTPPLDAVTTLPKPPLTLEPEKPAVTTAERVVNKAEGRSEAPQRTSEQRRQQLERRRQEQEKARRNRTATIAIISCSAVIVLAIIVTLIVTLGSPDPKITVPDLRGEVYENLAEYPGFTIKVVDEVFSSEVEAGKIISHEPEAGKQVTKTNDPYPIYVTVSKGEEEEPVTMQDVVGQRKQQVKMMLDSMSLKLQVKYEEEYNDTVAEGCIIRTEPEAGVELTEGQDVILYISLGKNIKTTTMVDVVDKTLETAKKMLEVQELDLDVRTEEINDNTVEKGKVVKTEPAAGEKLKTGQTVTLYISKGPELKMMPNVVGKTVTEATKMMEEEGFINYEFVPVKSEEEKDTVVSQSAEKYEQIEANARIILEVSEGPAPTEATTVPEETEPKTVVKRVTINLPDGMEEDYTLSIHLNDIKVYEQKILISSNLVQIQVDLEGSGRQYYDVHINGQRAWSERVDFTA